MSANGRNILEFVADISTIEAKKCKQIRSGNHSVSTIDIPSIEKDLEKY